MARILNFFISFFWWLVLHILFVVNFIRFCLILLFGDLRAKAVAPSGQATPTPTVEKPAGDNVNEGIPDDPNIVTSSAAYDLSPCHLTTINDHSAVVPVPGTQTHAQADQDTTGFISCMEATRHPTAPSNTGYSTTAPPIQESQQGSNTSPEGVSQQPIPSIDELPSDVLRLVVPCWDLDHVTEEDSSCLRPPVSPPILAVNIAQEIILRAEELRRIFVANKDPYLLRRAVHLLDHLVLSLSHGHLLAATLFLRAQCRHSLFSQTHDTSLLDQTIEACQTVLGLRSWSLVERHKTLVLRGHAFSDRYGSTGGADDLDGGIESYREALEEMEREGGRPPPILGRLGDLLLKRHWKKSTEVDLNDAIHCYSEALSRLANSHPARSSGLNNLACALHTRYLKLSNISDLEEAIGHHHEALSLRDSDHPSRPISLSNLAIALYSRYRELANISDLEQAIDYHREALSLRADDDPSSLHNLAIALHARCRVLGNILDLQEAVDFHREVLSLLTDGHPDRPSSFYNLAIALHTRYEKLLEISDLEEAINCHHKALELWPDDHPDRPSNLSNLAIALHVRYQKSENISDLEEAIDHHHEALPLLPHDHQDYLDSLCNLATALQARYEEKLNIFDLEEAIDRHHEALLLLLDNDPQRPFNLYNLATALHTRCQRLGNTLGLEEAIAHHREALLLWPPKHPSLPSNLNNLANALLTRHERSSNISDLEEAVNRLNEALSLLPGDHPDRPSSLSTLANTLHTRFWSLGNATDLEDAINYHRDALSLQAADHPDRLITLNNLANTLHTRYEQFGNVCDLEEAIGHLRQALLLWPNDDPDRPSCLLNLANTLHTCYQRLGNMSHLEEAIIRYREVLSLEPNDHPDRSSNLSNLAVALITRYERSGSMSDLEEASRHTKEALSTCDTDDPERWRYTFNLATILYCRYERKNSVADLKLAIPLFEAAVSLLPISHPDRPATLHFLGIALLQRAGDPSDSDVGMRHIEESFSLFPRNSPERQGALLNFLVAFTRSNPPTCDWTLLRDRCIEVAKMTPSDHPDYSQMTSLIAPILHAHHEMASELLVAVGLDPGLNAEDTTLAFLRKGSQCSASPSIEQLRVTCDWLAFSEKFGRPSSMEMYDLMLKHLDLAVYRGSSLDIRRRQLSGDTVLLRGKRLVSDAVACALDQGLVETAVEFLERGRSVLFAQLSLYRASSGLADVDPVLACRFESLSWRVESATVTEDKGLQDSASNRPFEDPISRSDRLRREWEAVVKEIREIQGFERFLQPTPFVDLQKASEQGPVILININKRRSDAIIVKPRSSPTVVPLPSATPERVDYLVDLFKKVAKSQLGNDNRAPLESLWDDVVEPVVSALQAMPDVPGGSRIWWCPTSAATTLPLHAAGIYYSGGKRLPDLYISSYTPTLTALSHARQTPSNRSGVPNLLLVGQSHTPGFQPLFAVPEEIDCVKGRIPHATVIKDEQGTRDAVLSAIKQHPWIHLSCHGIVKPRNPLTSHFALHDGPLSLLELIQNHLPDAQLAFLSCCHTASGDSAIPDEFLHLAAGMQFVGFKSIVGTMWAMDDAVGPMLADDFYRVLLGKKGKKDYRNSAKALSDALKIARQKKVPLQVWINFVHWGA